MTAQRPSHRSQREADLVAKLREREARIAELEVALGRAVDAGIGWMKRALELEAALRGRATIEEKQ